MLELVELSASAPSVARSVRVAGGLAFIERGASALGEDFRIQSHIVRRPRHRRAAVYARHALARLRSPRQLWWALHARRRHPR